MRECVSNGHIDSTWLPSTNGSPLGPRVLASDEVQLGIGGDFATIDTEPRQGLGQLG